MKYVREHINEKFTQDSDPIEDMGIGVKQKIIDLQNRYRRENYSEKGNFIDLANFYIVEYEENFEQKEAVLDYLLTHAKYKDDTDYLVLVVLWYTKLESEMLKYFHLFNKKGIKLTQEKFILYALEKKLYKVAQFILDIGFNINYSNDILLSDAFVNNDNNTIDWLLKRGAKLRVKDRNYRIFKAALKNNDEQQIAMCAKAYLKIK